MVRSPCDLVAALQRLRQAPIKRRSPARFLEAASRIAEESGWAKTNGAEHVALADILRCRLLTIDERLKRAASRIVKVVGPLDL